MTKRVTRIKSYIPLASAAWEPPGDYSQSGFEKFKREHGIRELKRLAHDMGIDSRLSKDNLALCVYTSTNIFFKTEIGNYTRATLLHFIRSFQISPLANEHVLTNEKLRAMLLSVAEGGSDQEMAIYIQDIIKTNDVLLSMEA